MMTKFQEKALALGTIFAAMVSVPASAQINFSEESSRLASIEGSVNDCATKQGVTICLNALAHARMLRQGIAAEGESADKIMIETVELVPLYVLARLSQLDGDMATACAYATEGEAQLLEIALMTERLAAKDPGAFQGTEKTFSGLGQLRQRYGEVQVACGEGSAVASPPASSVPETTNK